MTLDPFLLCGLGGERLGMSVAISVNCPASPETPKVRSDRLGKRVDNSLANGSRLHVHL